MSVYVYDTLLHVEVCLVYGIHAVIYSSFKKINVIDRIRYITYMLEPNTHDNFHFLWVPIFLLSTLFFLASHLAITQWITWKWYIFPAIYTIAPYFLKNSLIKPVTRFAGNMYACKRIEIYVDLWIVLYFFDAKWFSWTISLRG